MINRLLCRSLFPLLRYTNRVAKITVVSVRCLATLPKSFEEAQSMLLTLRDEPDNKMKLQIYALFKQATVGDCNKPQPGMLDFVNRAKWDAWDTIKGIDKEHASNKYITIVSDLLKAENPSEDATEHHSSTSPTEENRSLPATSGISINTESNGILRILLSRPRKKNAITWEMYEAWIEALKQAADNSTVNVVVITGAGDYFCSGNDLTNFAAAVKPGADLTEMADHGRKLLQRFVGAFIDFPKPIVGLINGPAVGVAVTTLALYDSVYAADNATFHAPLTALGQTPEGCSSYTFPKLMGQTIANDVILFGRRLSAHRAKDVGLITDVFPAGTFQKEAEERVTAIASLPQETLGYAKDLFRARERDILHKVNAVECERLAERWSSVECRKAITNFITRK